MLFNLENNQLNLNKIRKLFKITTVPYFTQALLGGSAAGTEHIKILKNLQCKFVVDIGANRGQFALVARYCYPDAFIHSVEPLEEPGKIFSSIFNKDRKVKLHKCAIGSKSEIKTIYISEQDDSSSLLPIGTEQVKLFPDTKEKDTREVIVHTLDECIESKNIAQPALLKIDVQGFELETLKGCLNLLHHFSFLYIEASFVELYNKQALAHEIIEFLAIYGFYLHGIYNTYYDKRGKAIQADFFFNK